jgi:hypothetical protein
MAPAFNYVAISTAFVRNLQAQFPTGDFSAPVVTPAVLRLLAAKVTETATRSMGAGRRAREPAACTFTLASLQACPNDAAADGA